MAPWGQLLKAMVIFEDAIIRQILRSPSFHRAVGRIERMVHESQHGRDPNEPLRPGEATRDQSFDPGRAGRFARFFVEELKNQARGTPTEHNQPPPPAPPPRRWPRR